MGAVFNLLEQHRLQSYHIKFLELGVKDERDFLDVTEEDLNTICLSQVEKNRFSTMKETIRRLRAAAHPAAAVTVKKSMESFCLQYTYPKCPEPKYIRDMDPAQNTLEDLMLRICILENVDRSKGVCLYTVDGMPLTDDPFFNTSNLMMVLELWVATQSCVNREYSRGLSTQPWGAPVFRVRVEDVVLPIRTAWGLPVRKFRIQSHRGHSLLSPRVLHTSALDITGSLKDRHVKSGDVIYAIFTPKENLNTSPKMVTREITETHGTDTVRCHVMLRGDFEVTVDLESDTIANLKNKLAVASGIPGHVLHFKGEHGIGNTLETCGISDGSTVYFSLSTFTEEVPDHKEFFINDVVPSVQQSTKGMSVLLSSLYIIKNKAPGVPYKNLIGYIRKLTGCNPLAQSLFQLLWRNEIISRNQKIAVIEGLYLLFRELLPQLGKRQGDKIIEDLDVFEYSTYCWAHLMSEAKKETSEHENYAPFSLISDEGHRFSDPVNVPGVPGVLERAVVLKKIRDGEKIPNCSEEVLRETSLTRAIDIEKIVLSVHPSLKTYHLWISHDSVTGQNFCIHTEKSFGDMAEEIKTFPQLNVIPPLRLKDLGIDDLYLVLLTEDNLGVYFTKDKACPAQIKVYDCLAGKVQNMNVDVLAARTGDHRNDCSFVTTRTPKEAIMVLIDTSSSMTENCYESVEIQKIHAVKQLFDNFATRTMAYDFHHVIGLATFDSTVKTVHTFTETLEKFKEHVHTLEANGRTKLYDALQHGMLELEKVKKFPDCKRRILCLTDGCDVGSSNKPDVVTANLIKSNIIVDSILLGEGNDILQGLRRALLSFTTSSSLPLLRQENNILRGISNATGGCCFKPKTSKEGLKLFEIETVLSLEMRKPKSKADPSSITTSFLTELAAAHGYDEFPETVLPSQMGGKVTVTETALKKKIRDAKIRQLMEKDKRILEELRSLHCDPHPYFSIFPTESDFTFWKIVMEGPPDTPYEKGVFELFCQFGPDYPVKPPLVRFVTRVYHCNINNVGRICHNIFDRNYNAQITMRDILNAVYGLLIIPEPEDPLDSILAEEFLTSPEKYEQEAKKHTEQTAAQSRDEMEKKLVDPGKQRIPPHLICPLTNKLFVDPVKTSHGAVYERKAIEKHLRDNIGVSFYFNPLEHLYCTQNNTNTILKGGPEELLTEADLKPANEMKKMVVEYRSKQLQEK
ncbi:hypothetical protein L3Q82_016513 [Scortum barcoo]|uniref:Uncharacterized protein n=1 Tax=Scortum barcoo TaxID=214431 RepID=A0ACB8X7M7_9TELE|nr:hypothetical protein L3Q82_016513 [Scortum barcoo]